MKRAGGDARGGGERVWVRARRPFADVCPLCRSGVARRVKQHVVEIVDHHQDGKECAAVTGDRRRIAFDDGKGSGIASCCTLVADWFKDSAPSLLPQVAVPLLGAWLWVRCPPFPRRTHLV